MSIDPPAATGDPAGRRETPQEAVAAIRRQKGQADKAVDWTVRAVGLSPLLGGPAVATLISPAVDTGNGWLGVFLSTLAFAGGVAAFTAVLKTNAFGHLAGWPLVTLAGLCLLGGFGLAAVLGTGSYTSAPVVQSTTGTPLDLPLMFVAAAIASWGVVGALLSAGSGVAAGLWGVRASRAVA